MLRRLLVLVGIAFALAAPASTVSDVDAASVARLGPELLDDTLTADYPAGITFAVRAQSSTTINHVTLRFGTTTTTTCQQAVAIRDLEFDIGDEISASYTWDFRASGTVPPGAEVWWEWEITDHHGEVLRTERRTQILTDQRFTWQTVSADDLTVYWADGDAAFGDTLLAIAREAAQSLEAEAGLSVSEPVRLTIYPDFDSMREALLDVAEWTGGLAYSDYNAVLIGIAPDREDWARLVIPHEYTHLVTGAATANCLSVYMPTWLSEGLSMHFEGSLSAADDTGLADRVRAGILPPLRELANGFSAYGDDANTSYTQSGRVVTYLLDTYGPASMSALLAEIGAGKPVDDALRTSYGFDTNGLDSAWRAALLGDPVPTLPPPMTATLAPTPTVVPTIVAWNGVPTPAVPTARPTTPVTIVTPAPSQPGVASATPYASMIVVLSALCLCVGAPGLLALLLAGAIWLVVRGSKG